MFPALTTEAAFARYEAIRARLPALAGHGGGLTSDPHKAQSETNDIGVAPDLGALADQFDVFVFDAFGVLNVGESPIEGACERIEALRAMGKALFVLTNAASYSFPQTIDKFNQLGFSFRDEELISSRAVCELHLGAYSNVGLWGVIGPDDFLPSQLAISNSVLGEDAADYDAVDGFLFLSAANWSRMKQTMLMHSLAANPRPVVVANPDLVAPREYGLSLEPGYFAHDLQDNIAGLQVQFHGKPYGSVYDHIHDRLGGLERIDPSRIAMLGDTLHTDILGAKACGWKGILVSDHGLFKGKDVRDYISLSGIIPDYIIPSI